MTTLKEGSRVRIVTRPVTEDDRKKSTYFSHMAGLTGTIQNAYADGFYAMHVDKDKLEGASKEVHASATKWMRGRTNITEEAKKLLTAEELDFNIHFMLLVKGSDLEAI